ncbi:hypothetical protein B0H17DRAFT_1159766 [Mycena rosella]|uniref:Sugar phosphate transporter domain-containing protein n=1 Tax=Mycena rosella TaxID=1033263 RepID=A0AAD7GES7_MYCRO|nr:hypothetical protein B0H17DRAFT_1159766 [Mycena rosella]
MQHETQHFQLKVAGAVCFYIVAALVMVFVNKAVLNKTPDLPFTFLFIQLAIAVLLLRLLALLSHSPLHHILPAQFELPKLDRIIAKKLFPFLSVGFIGLIFNTLCLANVDASFFQIARGLLLPFTILVASLCARTVPRAYVLLAAAIVTGGFLVGIAPSLYPGSTAEAAREPLKALVYGFVSCLVLSVHAVLSKAATAHVTHSVVALSYWGNLMMSLMMVPCVVLNGEIAAYHRRFLSPDEDWTTFVVGSAVTGLFGCLLGIANAWSIKLTSPITHMFSSAARSVIQTVLGVLIFGDIMTTYRLGGIGLITCGTIFYTWAQSQSHAKPAGMTPVPTTDVEKQTEKSEETSDSDFDEEF